MTIRRIGQAVKSPSHSGSRDGPRIGLVFEYAYGESTLTQTVVLTQSDRRIDFETDVD